MLSATMSLLLTVTSVLEIHAMIKRTINRNVDGKAATLDQMIRLKQF